MAFAKKRDRKGTLFPMPPIGSLGEQRTSLGLLSRGGKQRDGKKALVR